MTEARLNQRTAMLEVASEKWLPIQGDFTQLFRQNSSMDPDIVDDIVSEATGILSLCTKPGEELGSRTGLVVGYVQSGKTASFTALSAIAVDNQYQIIIVISGVTRNLYGQSMQRLMDDLGARRNWEPFDNPKKTDRHTDFKNALTRSGQTPRRKPILITVMKNATHLHNLNELLRDFDLSQVATLVVDDEADQASLNNKARTEDEEPSKINRLLGELRGALPFHTYVEYTATPQAPLLIEIADSLSPEFVKVLDPGTGYTGGKTYFGSKLENLIRRIPEMDVELLAEDAEVPDSLTDALAMFFVGVAFGLIKGDDRKTGMNRSMLIHPAHKTVLHSRVHSWVEAIRNRWQETLDLEPADQDFQDLKKEFKAAFDEISTTYAHGLEFQAVMDMLPAAIGETKILLVNSTSRLGEVVWENQYSAILVGGNKLDRGYTVQGLTVTYMPRSLGTLQADTIQQRARWFGYKEEYLGLCRVFLTDEAEQVYLSYMETEEDLRNQLKSIDANGQPLREWRRALLLHPKLKPTRANVIKTMYTRGQYSDQWFRSSYPNSDVNQTRRNRNVVDNWVQGVLDTQHQLSVAFGHKLITGLRLKDVVEHLISRITFDGSPDAVKYTGVGFQLGMALEEFPDAPCTVVLMSGERGRNRRRSVSSAGSISELHQGYSPKNAAPQDRTYPGDVAIGDRSEVVVQIHTLDLIDRDGIVATASGVPALAVWIPKKYGAPWIVQ